MGYSQYSLCTVITISMDFIFILAFNLFPPFWFYYIQSFIVFNFFLVSLPFGFYKDEKK